MRKAPSGYFAFCKAHREGQRPRCPIRRRTGNEDVAPPVWLNPARKLRKQISRNHCPTRHTCWYSIACFCLTEIESGVESLTRIEVLYGAAGDWLTHAARMGDARVGR